MTVRDTIRDLLTNDWQSFADLYDAACRQRAHCRHHFRNSLRAMHTEGMIDRKQMPAGKGWYYAYRIKSESGDEARKRTSPENPVDAAPATPLPKGCEALTNNGRDWYRATRVPEKAKYARTADGKHYRRVRLADVSGRNQTHWRPVTAAHVEHMGKERVFG